MDGRVEDRGIENSETEERDEVVDEARTVKLLFDGAEEPRAVDLLFDGAEVLMARPIFAAVSLSLRICGGRFA